MKPKKVLIFFLYLFLFLLLLSFFYPEKGLKLYGDKVLKFYNIRDILKKDTIHYADITKIISIDSLDLTVEDSIKKDTFKINIDTLKTKTKRFEYPDSVRTQLLSFFKSLDSIKYSKKPLHIFHYGDSQIEGDRVTSDIRNYFQSTFGGSGIGLLPLVQVVPNPNIQVNYTEGWQRFTLFGVKDKALKRRDFGVMNCLSYFKADDSVKRNVSLGEASTLRFQTKEAGFNIKSYKAFNRFTVFMNNKTDLLRLNFSNKKNVTSKTDSLRMNEGLAIYRLYNTGGEFSVNFNAQVLPDIYSLCFDGKNGIFVDNIPMRGSSGLEFTRNDFKLLRTMYDSLNVKLFILQFGVNLVPYIVDSYDYYEYALLNQLRLLKKLKPDAAIIVVGVSDVAIKENEHYVSYPNIIKIRNAQKNAALKAGCLFWDLYEAMGGNNSMPAWVNANPPLANKDFTHFSGRGAKLIAKMLYNALMLEYLDYKKSSSGKVSTLSSR
ncbi:MAG: hypothetical protein KA792_02880 [Bacteroidales bacterium]|nr:hypothetical protein [Bacteroidales bacterium]